MSTSAMENTGAGNGKWLVTTVSMSIQLFPSVTE
jgi:hypothetical protein